MTSRLLACEIPAAFAARDGDCFSHEIILTAEPFFDDGFWSDSAVGAARLADVSRLRR